MKEKEHRFSDKNLSNDNGISGINKYNFGGTTSESYNLGQSYYLARKKLPSGTTSNTKLFGSTSQNLFSSTNNHPNLNNSKSNIPDKNLSQSEDVNFIPDAGTHNNKIDPSMIPNLMKKNGSVGNLIERGGSYTFKPRKNKNSHS